MTFTVQHIRSADYGRRPTPDSLAAGQLAVNYNSQSTGLFFKTDTGALVKAGPTFVGNSPPPQTNYLERSIGAMWLDTSTFPQPLLKIWLASGWATVSTEVTQTSVFIPPQSPTGLPSGAVWNNNGVLTIVP
jgi:hypothetical protein